jgi:hypothetical protein
MTDDVAPTAITDCGPNGGCGECDVCRRLNFLEWVRLVAGSTPHSVEANPKVDAYIFETYGVKP